MAFSIAIVYELDSGWRWRVLECLILKVETFVFSFFFFFFFLVGGGGGGEEEEEGFSLQIM